MKHTLLRRPLAAFHQCRLSIPLQIWKVVIVCFLYWAPSIWAEGVIYLSYTPNPDCPHPTFNLDPPPFTGIYVDNGYIKDIEGGRRTLYIGFMGWTISDGSKDWYHTYEIQGNIKLAGTYSVNHYLLYFHQPCGTVISSGVIADTNSSPVKPQENAATRGDPFNAITGQVQQDLTDVLLPDCGLPLELGRAYNSGSGATTFGMGWQLSLEWQMAQPNGTNDTYLYLVSPDKRRFWLGKNGNVWYSKRDLRLRMRSVYTTNGIEWDLDGCDNGLSMRFDSNGRWKWTDDGWSNRITATRSGTFNRLTRVTHSSGRRLAIEWNDLNGAGACVTQVKDATPTDPQDWKLLAEYSYDTTSGFKLLTSCCRYGNDGSSVTTSYGYDRVTLLLTNRTDALGRTFVHRYGGQPGQPLRCVASGFSDGRMTTTATWDTGNNSVNIEYPVASGVSRYESITWRTDVPRLNTVSQDGETLTYTYDATTLEPTNMVWQAGSQTAASYTVLDTLGRATNTTFLLGSGTAPNWRTEWHDTLDLPLAEVDPLDWRTEYTWTNGLLATVRTTNGFGGWITSSLVWSQGILSAISDPMGRVTSFACDSYGSLTNLVPPAGPSLACTNDALGKPIWFRLPDANNGDRVWQVERDGFGRATRVIDPENGETCRAYDLLGHMTSSVDRAGRQTFYTYGTAGRPLSVTRVIAENGTNRTVTLTMDYDLQMEPTAIRDALDRTVESWVPDAAGRVARITNIEGRVASITYGVLDLPQAIDRFDGTSVTFAYNTAGQLAELTFPVRTTQFAWLDNGLPAAASDGTTTVTNEWIAPGRLTAQETRTTNWTGRVEYRHDLTGAVTQTLASAIGLEQTVDYDAGGRETNRIAVCNGTTVASIREYADWNGLLSRVTAGPLGQVVGWDRLDRLTNLTWRVSNVPIREVAFRHDLLGRITQRVDRVAEVEIVRNYIYDDLDRLIFEEHSTGFMAAYAFDDAGRRTTKSTAQFDLTYTAGDGDRLAHWEVTNTNLPGLDVAGATTELPATNALYRFIEVRNALSSVSPTMNGTNFTATLTPQPLGTQTVVAAISDAAGNVGLTTNTFVSTAYTTGEYASDPAGCVTQIVYHGPSCRQERTLTWDSQYRLISVATNDVTAESYGYDPYGRRIWTATAGITNWHMQDGAHVLADLDSTGGVLRTYLYGPNIDELIAMTVHTGAVAQTYYAIRDHQNTVWDWVDETGKLVESYNYDAWGRVLAVHDGTGALLISDLGLPISTIGNRFLFQGREYSQATGLYQFRARWYDPLTGRWLSNDPIGISGGLNQYVFCANNPINFRDPFGMEDINLYGPVSNDSAASNLRKSVDNEITVGGHGASGVVIDLRTGQAQVITPATLATEIKTLPNYGPNKTVQLGTCEGAKGNNSTALQLSNLLPNPIKAATGKTVNGIAVDTSGRIVGSTPTIPDPNDKTSTWVTYQNGKLIKPNK